MQTYKAQISQICYYGRVKVGWKADQIGGAHYKEMKIQPLEFSLANELGPCESAVVKYVSRWKRKGGVEDLRKARHYIEALIDWEINKTK